MLQKGEEGKQREEQIEEGKGRAVARERREYREGKKIRGWRWEL